MKKHWILALAVMASPTLSTLAVMALSSPLKMPTPAGAAGASFVPLTAAEASAAAAAESAAPELAAATPKTPDADEASPADPLVARGAYLVKIMGCNDCHTPWKMGPKGPEPDMSRMLIGHPQDLVMTPAPKLDGPWAWAGGVTNTSFAGPWGISFAANLTPDPETGLGKWTAETFITALRTGKHEGQGRPILPPMPYPMYRNATDGDLRAVFAFLQTLPPVKNRVPQPVDPPEAP